ncbi:MAG: serine/threonine-protein kinase, partial [Sedimenticola sp.]
TGSVNDQIIGNLVATGSVNDQIIGNPVATGSVNDQIIGSQVATGSVNDQISGNLVATGSVNDQIIGNQIARDSGIELCETLFNYETNKPVNTGAVKRGNIEPDMNIPDKKPRMSLNSTASIFREPPPVKQKYNALEDNISNLHVKYEDFKILEKIGEGGFGEVYQGKYLGTNVAVKKLKVKRMKLVRQSVLQEVQINSHIRHPSIVLLMGYSIQADSLYLLTELITGPNLDDVLFGDLGHEFTLTHKHSIALQVCQAISYLHNRNPVIIHRDIKPENILLSKNFEIAKVCDMGLSKLKVMNTMTTTIADKRQMQPGTPAYQAPEILLNFRTAKRPSDIWSLCCTYVELYAEKTAWNMDHACIADDDGDSSVQIIINCMERKETPHGLVHLETEPYISSEIIAIIREGLQYDMTKRPSALHVCKVFS